MSSCALFFAFTRVWSSVHASELVWRMFVCVCVWVRGCVSSWQHVMMSEHGVLTLT